MVTWGVAPGWEYDAALRLWKAVFQWGRGQDARTFGFLITGGTPVPRFEQEHEYEHEHGETCVIFPPLRLLRPLW
jgi:hypothetical protein